MYSTYETPVMGDVEDEARPTDARKIVILGGGPNRIGQGIEFDYCCCHACFALSAAGFETIMINCNPETVSTDYDTSDRLYFEPLTLEHVLEILRVEQSNGTLLGVIVQFGGQTPLKLADALAAEGIPILGTSPDAIDLAEDRERFQQLLHQLGLRQPVNGIARSARGGAAHRHAGRLPAGDPPLLRARRPGDGDRARRGAARPLHPRRRRTSRARTRSCSTATSRARSRSTSTRCATAPTSTSPASWSTSRRRACTRATSACSLPPHTLPPEIVAEMERQTRVMALALGVVGLMNVQFAIKDGEVYVLEVNPRASRTVPFVAKATDSAIAAIAARLMAGEKLAAFAHRGPWPSADEPVIPLADPMTLADPRTPWFSVKEAVMPFARFPGVDTLLGPEMRSTGEVMGWDRSFPRAFLKAQLGAGQSLPRTGTRVPVDQRLRQGAAARRDRADPGRARGSASSPPAAPPPSCTQQGLPAEIVNKVYEGRPAHRRPDEGRRHPPGHEHDRGQRRRSRTAAPCATSR